MFFFFKLTSSCTRIPVYHIVFSINLFLSLLFFSQISINYVYYYSDKTGKFFYAFLGSFTFGIFTSWRISVQSHLIDKTFSFWYLKVNSALLYVLQKLRYDLIKLWCLNKYLIYLDIYLILSLSVLFFCRITRELKQLSIWLFKNVMKCLICFIYTFRVDFRTDGDL